MASAASINAPRVKRAELARLLGVSRQAIGDLVRRKVLEVGADERIDVELARHAIESRVRPSGKSAATLAVAPAPAAAPAASGAEQDATAVTSYHVAKTLREVAEARIAQLKLAELRGELVRAADVKATYAQLAAGLREALLQIPARMAAVLAAEADQGKVHDILRAELHQVLAQLHE
jgi:hypothetical protein